MFREIKVSRVPADGRKRRWYQSSYFDLFVWYVPATSPQRFSGNRRFVAMQLCYDRGRLQRNLEWSDTRGFKHHEVHKESDSMADHGASAAQLIEGGVFDAEAVLPRFLDDAPGLPPQVRDFVIDRLRCYADTDASSLGETVP